MKDWNTKSGEIGVRIGKLRTERRMSQVQLAKAIGYNRHEPISQLENGDRAISTKQLFELSNFFDVSCDYIMRGIETTNASLHREYGLSNKALETLKGNNDNATKDETAQAFYAKQRMRVVELLLENVELLDLMARFFFQKFPVEDEKTEYSVQIAQTSKDGTIIDDCEVREMTFNNDLPLEIKDLRYLFLAQIQRHLIHLKESDNLKSKFNKGELD